MQPLIQKEQDMYNSIEQYLKNNFGCEIIKKEIAVASSILDKENNKDQRFINARNKDGKKIEYKASLRVDVVGYSSEEKSLYIVECKSVTDLTTQGVITAVGQIMVDKMVLLLFGVDDVREKLRLKSNDEIKNLYFYIALPDLPDSPDGSESKGSINERIPPAAMKVLDKLRKEQGIGLLKVIDLNDPAEIHFCAKPVNI